MISKDPLAEWMSAAEASTFEIARTALGVVDCRRSPPPTPSTPGTQGSYIPLIGDHLSVQVGLISNDSGCQTLAKALLGMAGTPDVLSPADVADAVGEVVNMIAGQVKRRLNEQIPSLALGLPIFIHGKIEPTAKMSASSLPAKAGQ